MIDVMCCHSAI